MRVDFRLRFKAHCLSNEHSATRSARLRQAYSYSTGEALTNHCNSAHDGAFDKNCRACQEIKARSEKAISKLEQLP